MDKIRLERESAGHYRYRSQSGALFEVTKFISAYGDIQWMIDVEEPNGKFWRAQVNTLADARLVISDPALHHGDF